MRVSFNLSQIVTGAKRLINHIFHIYFFIILILLCQIKRTLTTEGKEPQKKRKKGTGCQIGISPSYSKSNNTFICQRFCKGAGDSPSHHPLLSFHLLFFFLFRASFVLIGEGCVHCKSVPFISLTSWNNHSITILILLIHLNITTNFFSVSFLTDPFFLKLHGMGGRERKKGACVSVLLGSSNQNRSEQTKPWYRCWCC